MSGLHIHPFFVHLAHLCGAQFYQEIQGSYFLQEVQAMHFQFTLDALASMREEHDPLSLAQALYSTAMVYAYTKAVKISKVYFKRCMAVIRRNNIRVVPHQQGYKDQSVLPDPLELHEKSCERVAFLAQMLYIEDMVYIIGQPARHFGYRLGYRTARELTVGAYSFF